MTKYKTQMTNKYQSPNFKYQINFLVIRALALDILSIYLSAILFPDFLQNQPAGAVFRLKIAKAGWVEFGRKYCGVW